MRSQCQEGQTTSKEEDVKGSSGLVPLDNGPTDSPSSKGEKARRLETSRTGQTTSKEEVGLGDYSVKCRQPERRNL